jgi:hypothetical protein
MVGPSPETNLSTRPAPSRPATGTATVVVACKHPPGIFMRAFGTEEHDVQVLGGGTRKEKRSFAVGEPFKINGPAVMKGESPPFIIAGGYALTTGVPADLAETWMEQNKDSALVKNRLIFVADSEGRAKDQGKEQREIQSGLQPLDVRMVKKDGRDVPRDPRWPARVNPNLTSVKTDTNKDIEAA